MFKALRLVEVVHQAAAESTGTVDEKKKVKGTTMKKLVNVEYQRIRNAYLEFIDSLKIEAYGPRLEGL
ncbi:MAG: hypothetical protein PVJ60_02215 [Phycisphaerales bacterium]|jgi:hypothetical protein